MHDLELQESQFGADEETPGQTGAPSEQEREHAELNHVLIGIAAVVAVGWIRRPHSNNRSSTLKMQLKNMLGMQQLLSNHLLRTAWMIRSLCRLVNWVIL
jgi:hypothetical protein